MLRVLCLTPVLAIGTASTPDRSLPRNSLPGNRRCLDDERGHGCAMVRIVEWDTCLVVPHTADMWR